MNTNPVVLTKPKLRCSDRHIPFSESHCLLPISVGQDAHESLKFQATLSLFNKQFKKISICLGDTLQRFTHAMHSEKSPEQLYSSSEYLGDLWIKRNQQYLNELTIPYDIVRWKSYLDNGAFLAFKEQILNHHASNHEFQSIINNTIEYFLNRYKRDDNLVNLKDCRNYCFDYLIEESAAMLLWAKAGYDYEAYPNRRNPAMQYVFENFLESTFKPKLTSILIKSVNFMY